MPKYRTPEIANALKIGRERKGLSQLEAAQHLGSSSQQMIWMIEHQRRFILHEELEKLCELYQIDIHTLLSNNSVAIQKQDKTKVYDTLRQLKEEQWQEYINPKMQGFYDEQRTIFEQMFIQEVNSSIGLISCEHTEVTIHTKHNEEIEEDDDSVPNDSGEITNDIEFCGKLYERCGSIEKDRWADPGQMIKERLIINLRTSQFNKHELERFKKTFSDKFDGCAIHTEGNRVRLRTGKEGAARSIILAIKPWISKKKYGQYVKLREEVYEVKEV